MTTTQDRRKRKFAELGQTKSDPTQGATKKRPGLDHDAVFGTVKSQTFGRLVFTDDDVLAFGGQGLILSFEGKPNDSSLLIPSLQNNESWVLKVNKQHGSKSVEMENKAIQDIKRRLYPLDRALRTDYEKEAHIVLPIEVGETSDAEGFNISKQYADTAWNRFILDEEEGEDEQERFQQATRCIHDIALGLERLHRANIAHLDVKPDNFFLDAERNVYLLADFGMAELLDGPFDSGIVKTRLTPKYMGPDIQTKANDTVELYAWELKPQDIYALGVSYVQLLAGTSLDIPMNKIKTIPWYKALPRAMKTALQGMIHPDSSRRDPIQKVLQRLARTKVFKKSY